MLFFQLPKFYYDKLPYNHEIVQKRPHQHNICYYLKTFCNNAVRAGALASELATSANSCGPKTETNNNIANKIVDATKMRAFFTLENVTDDKVTVIDIDSYADWNANLLELVENNSELCIFRTFIPISKKGMEYLFLLSLLFESVCIVGNCYEDPYSVYVVARERTKNELILFQIGAFLSKTSHSLDLPHHFVEKIEEVNVVIGQQIIEKCYKNERNRAAFVHP